MTIAVIVSPEAEAQIREIDSWWRENRKAAPDLFVQELAEATTTLETMPSAGHSTSHPEVKGLRRILLRATRYHVYYVSNAETVLILAVWSAVRGAGPDLKRLLH
jgi:plasmid stabilization system protein ParE